MIRRRRDGRTWVKICGISDPDHAVVAADAGADVIGVNVWPGSARAVTAPEAARVVDAAGDLPVVAVTVDATLAELREVVETTGVRGVQLHGDAAPAVADVRAALPGTTIISVLRIPPHATTWPRIDAGDADAVLVDAEIPGREGGTGVALQWRVPDVRGSLILSGGLDADNVATAIEVVDPFGVDVASGVESAPGVKDPERIRAFLDAVRSATGLREGKV